MLQLPMYLVEFNCDKAKASSFVCSAYKHMSGLNLKNETCQIIQDEAGHI